MNDMIQPVLFRCDGSSSIGIGHVMRCLALADELGRGHGITSSFAVRSDESAAGLIQRSNYPVFLATNSMRFDYRNWLTELINETGSRVLVLDVRDDLPISVLAELRQSEVLLITLDDLSQRRLYADLVFYPPVPQVDRLDWTECKGRVYKGWNWVPLRREISETAYLRKSKDVKTLLVTTGGADPAGMALSIVRFLHLMEKSFETVVVVGPAFQHRLELEQAVAVSSGEFRIENEPDSLPTLIAQADLAITAFGVTAYELAAMGVPAAYLCLTLDHLESASAFVTGGLGISLGLFSEIDATSFRNGILPLLRKPELRQQISQNGKRTVDGRGARRISALIARHLQGESGND